MEELLEVHFIIQLSVNVLCLGLTKTLTLKLSRNFYISKTLFWQCLAIVQKPFFGQKTKGH